MAKVAYFDCFAGLTGTMALAALLDAGLDHHTLVAEIQRLHPGGWTLRAERAIRNSIAGTEVRLDVDDDVGAFDLATLRAQLDQSGFDSTVRQRVMEVLALLAGQSASASVPLRSVIEVVGVVVGLAVMGVERVYAALPATPADVATHRSRHILGPMLDGRTALFDPVGAALLAGLAHLGRPPMLLHRAGYGLLSRKLPVLDAARVWIGDANSPLPQVTEVKLSLAMLQQWMGTSKGTGERTAVTGVAAKADAVLLIDDVQDGDTASYSLLAQTLAQRLSIPVYMCRTGSSVRQTVEACMGRGERRLVVAPLFRTPARRTMAELRGMLGWASSRWPNSAITITNPVWTPDHLLGVLARHADRALESVHRIGGPRTLQLVAEPSDEDENAEWFRLGRLLWERRRDPDLEVDVCFSHGTQPSLAKALQRSTQRGANPVVVLPTCLFEGTTLEQIATEIDVARGALDDRVLVAPPLARIASAAALIAQRVSEAVERTNERELVTHHGHTHVYTWDHGTTASPLLPPRYQGGRTVSAAPMGAAALRYDEDGKVAWDQIWTDFCDLALAGGPPHRNDLLEPADPAAVAADPKGYARVLDELRRGLGMVTGLPVAEGAPGWIGLRCADEEMALWMLRAIVVENVSVRREGATLFLPAGPDFRLEDEIKNVITAVAKTHHYWREHVNGPRTTDD